MNTQLYYKIDLSNFLTFLNFYLLMYGIFKDFLEDRLDILKKIFSEQEIQIFFFIHNTEIGQRLYKKYLKKELLRKKEELEKERRFIKWVIKRYPDKREQFKQKLLKANYSIFLINGRIKQISPRNGREYFSRKQFYS